MLLAPDQIICYNLSVCITNVAFLPKLISPALPPFHPPFLPPSFTQGALPPLLGSGIYRSTQFAVFEALYTKWDDEVG